MNKKSLSKDKFASILLEMKSFNLIQQKSSDSISGGYSLPLFSGTQSKFAASCMQAIQDLDAITPRRN